MAMGVATISEVYELEDTGEGMEATWRKWNKSDGGRRSQGRRPKKANGGR